MMLNGANAQPFVSSKPVLGYIIQAETGDYITSSPNGITVKFKADRKVGHIELVCDNCCWDFSKREFLLCDIENLGTAMQIVEVGINDQFWTMGATHIGAGTAKTVKALLYKDEEDSLDQRFPGMQGHPDGFTKLWFKTHLDSVHKVTLIVPDVQPGAILTVRGLKTAGTFSTRMSDIKLPFTDKYGQYIHGAWSGKISSDDDLKRASVKEALSLSHEPVMKGWDAYGGFLKGPKLTATGKFRVQKYKGQWWLVDPGGRLFWSTGIDCIGADGMTRIKGRAKYFKDLPAGPVFNEFYNSNHSSFDFLSANLYRKYGADWKTIFAQRTQQRLKSWGINTIGNWSDPAIYRMRKTPYVTTLSGKKTDQLVDPFHPSFQADLEKQITSMTKSQMFDDPWCLGFFVDNELKWQDLEKNLIVSGASQPAKQAFRDYLKDKYLNINQLNSHWKARYASWDDFLNDTSAVKGRAALSDIHRFAVVFADVYFKKCRAAVRAAAPGFLYLGCRFDFHSYPADSSLSWVVRAASQYCDVVSFNRYTYTSSALQPPSGSDFPILIGEFHFGSLDHGLFHPGLKYTTDQQERSAFYESFMNEAVRNPYIVGAHWFQYYDQPLAGRSDGENYQIGFVTVADTPYQLLVDKVRKLAKALYSLRLSNK